MLTIERMSHQNAHAQITQLKLNTNVYHVLTNVLNVLENQIIVPFVIMTENQNHQHVHAKMENLKILMENAKIVIQNA